ncbi:DUF502 domain-containing protein [Mesonia aquimarina]|uniref:hypothetical protein n=1 Tax=Mesonia aquimarina TaxID=1504967 RepID=UPI000EF57A13|nr:hypothetical protein [Mesonia aquimarina]
MKIISNSSRTVILGGIFFLIPLLIIIFLLTHAIKILLPLGRELVDILEIHSVFGATTVTIVTLFLLLVFCYLSGYLVQKGLINDWGQQMEDHLFLMFPSLQMLKYRLLGDKPSTVEDDNWKAILLKEDNHYNIAFITGLKENYNSIYIPDAPKIDAGELRYIAKDDCDFIFISMKEAMKSLSSFGRDGNFFMNK